MLGILKAWDVAGITDFKKHFICQTVPQVKCSTTGTKKRSKQMTELLEEKIIIRSCYDAEHGACCSGYCGEHKRIVAAKLKADKFITYKEVAGLSHHIQFLGFTDAGRKKYLDAEGEIKKEYLVSKDDR